MRPDTKARMAVGAVERLGHAKRAKLAFEREHPTNFYTRQTWSALRDEVTSALLVIEGLAFEITAEDT